MSGLVEAFRRVVPEDSLARSCVKQGCRVSLEGVPKEHLLIDFDKLATPSGNATKRCDYLFISDGGPRKQPCVAPIELKKGRLRAREVATQIKSGARFAEKHVKAKTKVDFRPLAAYGGEATKTEIKKLRRKENKISFHDRSESVRLIRCGNPLMKAFRS